MARDNSVAVSDEELELIKEARCVIFNTSEVPYGVVIEHLCKDELNGN